MEHCYLCGEPLKKNVNKSKDHVPPDGIFPAGTPQVTVPCCIKCNEAYKELDEVMRNKFALLSEFAPSEIHEKTDRAFQKFPWKIKKMEVRTGFDSVGNIKRMMKFNPKDLDLWFERVVRGLYYAEYKKRIPTQFKFSTTALTYAPPIPEEHRLFLQVDARTSCFFCERMPDFLAEKFEGPGTIGWMSTVYQKIFFVTIIS